MSYNELLQRGTADFPIELYSVDEYHHRYEMVSHWHGEMEIIRVIRGNLNIRLNNDVYSLGKDDIVFVNPETIHTAIPTECIYECFVFDVDSLTAGFAGCKYFFEGLLNGEYMINEYMPQTETELCVSVDSIFNTMKHKSSGYKFKVVGELYKLFGIIIDKHLYSHISGGNTILKDKNFVKLKNAISYMRDNYEKQMTLEEMAKTAGMSAKYFCRFFKEMTRKSPVEYLNTYRVEKAARLLISTDINVTDIAYMSGFNDLSYFIKTFKMYKGVSPSKFRALSI